MHWGRAVCAVFGVLAVMMAAPALARCEGVAPGLKPQNAARDEVGQALDVILDRGFIEFAVYESFPPYSWIDDGKSSGIDIDIGRLIAASLGVDARFRFVAAGENLESDLLNNVWQGSAVDGHVVNVMLHVPYHSEFACRIDQVVFTGQYFDESIAIAFRRDAYPDDPPVPAYFRFDTVAVENDSIADFYLTSLAGGQLAANVRRYPDAAAAMVALNGGEVKAAMGPKAQLEFGLTDATGLHQPPLPGFAVGRWTLGVAVHTSHRDLGYAVDDAIAAGLADGRIAAIFASYGLSFTAPDR